MKRSSSFHTRKKHKFSFIKIFVKTVLILTLLAITVIMLTPNPNFKDGFKSLKELQAYANQTNEQTPMENADTLRPEFTKYYQSQIPTFSQKIKKKINLLLYLAGIKEKPVWSVSFFKTILENTEKSRKNAGHTDNLIYKIQTDPTSKFVILGNMQGAFHSLIRCLDKIKELGIIGDDLKITNPNNYIIFMGDLIDRSPFTLEILTVGLKLIEANPQNVIYMRGNHEAKDYWQEHTLKTELQIRAAHLSKETIPLQKEVSSFFNTLPIAIYLTMPQQVGQAAANEFVRISEFARSENEILNEVNYADFLTKQQSSKLDYLVIKEPYEAKPDITINIRASIHNEKKRKTFQKSEGLRLLAPDMDSVAWTILSCPTVVYQKALDFYNDAFVILSASDNPENWEITLYSRDVRTKDPFKETKFNFLSGLDINSHKIKMATTQNTLKAQIRHPQQVQQPVAQPQVIVPIPQQQTQVVTPAPQVVVQRPQTISQAQQPVIQQPQVIQPQTTPPAPVQQIASQQPPVAQPQVIVPMPQQQVQAIAPAPQVIVPIPQQEAQAIVPAQQPVIQQPQVIQPQTSPPAPVQQIASQQPPVAQPQVIVPMPQQQVQAIAPAPQVIVPIPQQEAQAIVPAQQPVIQQPQVIQQQTTLPAPVQQIAPEKTPVIVPIPQQQAQAITPASQVIVQQPQTPIGEHPQANPPTQ